VINIKTLGKTDSEIQLQAHEVEIVEEISAKEETQDNKHESSWKNAPNAREILNQAPASNLLIKALTKASSRRSSMHSQDSIDRSWPALNFQDNIEVDEFLRVLRDT